MAEGDFNVRAIVTAETSKFENGIKNAQSSVKSMNKEIDALGSKLKTVFSGMAGLFAASKLKSLANESVKAWKYQEKQLKLLSSTLKVTGANAWTSSEEIKTFASSLQQVTNYGDEAIIAMQNILLGFKEIKGDNFKEATKAILDMSTVMNMDLTSAAQTVGKALDDPIKGLAALGRQGFYFSDSQKEMLKNLVETGEKAKAQKIILDELYTAYGGAAEATVDISKQLANTWGDFKEQMGKGISEITNLFSKMVKSMLEDLMNMDASTKDFIKGFAESVVILTAVTAAVFALKAALDVLKAHPLILGISAVITGVSAVVGAITALSNSVENQIEENKKLNEEAEKLFINEKNVAEGKTIDAEQTLKLIELYPELSNKISAYNTTLSQAILLQKQANAQRVREVYQEQREELVKLRKEYNENKVALEKFQKQIAEENLLESWGEVTVNKMLVGLNKKLNESEADINKQITKINANLQTIGMKLADDGDYLVSIKPHVDENSLNDADKKINSKLKTWKEWLSKILSIDESKFKSGKQASELYIKQLKDNLEMNDEISKILGIPFSKMDYINSALDEVRKHITEALSIDPDEIDEPFDISELENENTALGKLVQRYKELQTQKGQTFVAEEIENLNKEILNLSKSDDELYYAKLRENGATEEQINKCKELKQIIKETREEMELLPEAQRKLFEQNSSQLDNWTDEWRDSKEKIIQMQEEQALKGIENEELRLANVEYYNNEILKLNAEFEDNKLQHEKNWLEKDSEFLESWSDQYYENQVKIINLDRQRELNATKNQKEIAKINEYYDKKILNTTKKYNMERIKVVTDAVKNLAKEGLEKLGEALVNGGASWDDFKYSALDALASVLEGIASQLSAMATANLMAENYKNAVIGFAGAAAALVAAGAIKAVVNNMKNMKESVDEITLSMEKFNNEMKELMESMTDTSSLLSGVNSIKNIIEDLTLKLNDSLVSIEEYSKLYTETQNKIIQNSRDMYDVMHWFKRNYYDKDTKEWNPFNITDEMLDNLDDYFNEFKKMKLYTKELSIAYSNLSKSVDDFNSNLLNSIKESEVLISSYKDMYNSMKLVEYLSAEDRDELTNSMIYVYEKYSEILKNYQLSVVEQTKAGIYENLIGAGNQIGESLIESIIDGAEKTDFLSSMKTYIRTNLIKLSVYTEEFSEQLASIGSRLATSMSTGEDLVGVRTELEELWESASKNAQEAERIIDHVFGDIASDIDSGTKEIEKSLTRLENLIENFKEEISDLGGDIATNLINGLSNGLSQSDFLSNMKTWLRKLIIQSVVYTESMKAEIESIGKVISEGISTGFSEETLHEIRRDLSYLFYSTDKKLSSIDSVLDSVFSGYATGTNNATRGLHLVGEAGPELVKFRGGEQVLNASNTQKALGNVSEKTNNFNVNFYDTKDTTAFAMLQQLRNYNRQMAVNGII